MTSDTAEPKKRWRLGVVLTVVFLFAMFMGPGPGLRLINPDPGDPSARFTFLGMPIIYAWGLLWYAVQVVVIVTAYFTVWAGRRD